MPRRRPSTRALAAEEACRCWSTPAAGRRGDDHHRVPRGSPSRPRAADPAEPRGGARRPDDGPVLRQLRHDADAEDRGSTPSVRRASATRTASPSARTLLETAYGWLDERWRIASGRRAARSAWPTAPRRRRCSTPTGRTRSIRRSRTCPCLSAAAARAAVVRARRRRGAALSAVLPARRARSRLTSARDRAATSRVQLKVASTDASGLQPAARTPWSLSGWNTPRLSTTDSKRLIRAASVVST